MQPAILMRGHLITFEGGEGAGKSTQVAALAKRLSGMGIATVATREPGGSPGAEIIRKILLSGAAKTLGPDGEAVLFAAARADHIEALLKPALAAGKWIICDRYINSTRVYQGAVGKVGDAFIKGLEKLTVGDVLPELTFILDVPANVGLARAHERRGNGSTDRFESQDLGFHEALNAAFRDIAKNEPERCVLIDSNRPADVVAADIWRIVRKRLSPENAPLTFEELVR